MTALQALLTSVGKLEEAKPNKQLKSLFSTKDRDKAENVRNKALVEVDTDTSDFENGKESLDTSTDEKSCDDFEFGPSKGKSGKSEKNSHPKTQLIKYLEVKNSVTHISWPNQINCLFFSVLF